MNKKSMTRTWLDVVEGLEEDELETTDSDKSGIELETADLVERHDSSELNHMEAKLTRG